MWQCESVTVWKCVSVTVWQCDSVKVWKCDSVKVWQCESVSVCQCVSVKVWKFDSVTVWKCGRLTEPAKNHICDMCVMTTMTLTGGPGIFPGLAYSHQRTFRPFQAGRSAAAATPECARPAPAPADVTLLETLQSQNAWPTKCFWCETPYSGAPLTHKPT